MNLCKPQDIYKVIGSADALFPSRQGPGSVDDAYAAEDGVGQLGTHELVQESLVAKSVELVEWAPQAHDRLKLVAGHHSMVRVCIMATRKSVVCSALPHSWEVLLEQMLDEGGLGLLYWPTRSSTGLRPKSVFQHREWNAWKRQCSSTGSSF